MVRHDLHSGSNFGRLALIFLIVMAVVLFTVPSWSSEQPSVEPASYKIAGDVCLPLLAAHKNSSAIKPGLNRTGRAAPAAALSLMFGVRYVVGPKESGKIISVPGLADKGVDSDYARAIASYRHCRNQKALEALAFN